MDKEENKQLIDGATDLLKKVNLRTSADANSLINEIMSLADSYSRILDEASILGVTTSLDKYKISYFNIIAMDENDGLQMQYGGGFLSSVCINGLELENNSDDVFQELQYGIARCGVKLLRSWASDQLVYGNEYKISKNKILSQYEDRYGKESMDRFLANYEAGLIQDVMTDIPITKTKSLKI